MAFVNESMGEAGVELIKSLNIQNPPGCIRGLYFDTHSINAEDKWIIDHERNLQFFCMFGGRGNDKIDKPPAYYCLVWHNQPIRIDAYESRKGDIFVGIQEVWEIVRIYAPLELKGVLAENLCEETIKEAFIAYAHRREWNIKSVDFPNMTGVMFISRESMWRYY